MENIKNSHAKESKETEVLHSEPVKTIFGMLYDILALYEASDCYNHIPGTDDTDGAWGYFEGRIGDVRKKLAADHLGKRESEEYRKLERISTRPRSLSRAFPCPVW